MNKNKKGFTLIELLVVIAIIGILSGLIIVSLGDATNSAKEAKIKSALDQLRPVAQLYYNTNRDYTNLATDSKVINIFADIEDNGGLDLTAGTNLVATDTAWCAYSTTPAGTCMCVDSKGDVNEFTNTTSCNCANATCDVD
ncbi:MAG: prepilin-type N-terminal cleavage/methylation domain-containing protein [Candidatus Pacebacteria bacterium]|nr:prepilin-type N-terminal cleavage/methylation domain-containing protein [Candidatus Paceibacterota bacterium]